jgi:hypothetical protein
MYTREEVNAYGKCQKVASQENGQAQTSQTSEKDTMAAQAAGLTCTLSPKANPAGVQLRETMCFGTAGPALGRATTRPIDTFSP